MDKVQVFIVTKAIQFVGPVKALNGRYQTQVMFPDAFSSWSFSQKGLCSLQHMKAFMATLPCLALWDQHLGAAVSEPAQMPLLVGAHECA